MKKIISLFICIVLLFITSGCENNSNMENIDIYTTAYPIEYVVSRLYDNHSTIRSIYPNGIDINEYKVTNVLLSEYSSKAYMFIFNGLSNEKNYLKPMLKKNKHLKIIDVTADIPYNKTGYEELWLNPSKLLTIANNIRKGFNEYTEAKYLKNDIDEKYQDLKVDLTNLEAKFRETIKNASNKTLIVSDDILLFLNDYGANIISLDPDNEDYEKNIAIARNLVNNNQVGHIYLKDDESIEENGLCEIKISENQFMNFNDRNEYLPDILDTLDGIEFYLNDFESTGIIYYEPCDLYGITIGETTYNCIMLNDDINVSQGLVENIYTDIPDGTETDYKKADKTDQRINKANLIVDKQGKQIEGLITEVGEHDARLTQLTINIDNIQNLFQITGGSNLIKNSQLLLPDDFWTFTDKEGSSQSYHTPLGEGYNGSLIGQTVAVANIVLRDCTATTKDINITNLKMSVPHVLNYYISQDKQTTSIVTLTAKNTGEVIYTDTVTTTTNEVSMKNKSISFITTDTEYILSIESSSASTGYTTIYDLMLNTGDKKSWEPSVSEVYSTILKMSQLGMQVFSSGSNILTLITSDGFQVREATQSGSGEINVGRIISEFDRDGLTTETAEMKKLIIGKYVQTEMTLSNVLHHVEYFQS